MQELTTDTFEAETKSGAVVVDFWAPWCGPCRMMAPQFEAAAEEDKETKYVKLNTDEHGEIAQKFGIRGIPTIVFLKDGEEVNRFTGAMDKAQILAKVKETFA